MKLKPIIASYSIESTIKIKRYLNEDVLEVIVGIAHSPKNDSDIAPDVLTELIEMHVFKEQNGLVILDTSVFFRDDIERILHTVKPLTKELSQKILKYGSAFQNAPPEITIFLAGIIGLVQGLGDILKRKHIAVDWKNYSGKYAQSKVDFDEVCDVYEAIGLDFLNKSVTRGEQYTAVFIGPEGGSTIASKVDAVAKGKLRTAVITNEIVQEYEGAIQAIIDIASSFYRSQLNTLDKLLRSTTAGRQGVRPANMMLNLFRYIRKLTAKELYSSGFFTDTIPTEGTLTVFYENDSRLIRRLLY